MISANFCANGNSSWNNPENVDDEHIQATAFAYDTSAFISDASDISGEM